MYWNEGYMLGRLWIKEQAKKYQTPLREEDLRESFAWLGC
jgi:hypothetical protein